MKPLPCRAFDDSFRKSTPSIVPSEVADPHPGTIGNESRHDEQMVTRDMLKGRIDKGWQGVEYPGKGLHREMLALIEAPKNPGAVDVRSLDLQTEPLDDVPF